MKAIPALIERSLLILVVSLAWISPTSEPVRAFAEGGSLVARIETPSYELTAEGVAVADYALHTAPGAPRLPLVGLTFELPGTGEWELSYESRGSRVLAERVAVAAAPVPALELSRPVGPQELAELPSAVPVVDRPDPGIYEVDAFYPATPVVVGEVMVQSGRRVLPVRVFPFQYNPVTQELRYHPDVVVTVEVRVQAGAEGEAPAAPPPGDFYEAVTVPGEVVMRVHTKERGLYRLTYGELTARGVPSGADPGSFAVYYQGEQVDIHVTGAVDNSFDPGDVVIFYAEPYDGGRYQNYNVYQFAYGGGVVGQRMVERAVTAPPVPPAVSTIKNTLRVEADHAYYSNLLRPAAADHFLDVPLEAKSATPTVKSYDLALNSPVAGAGTVEIKALVYGGKSQVANPDQSVQLKLNSYAVGVYQWDGRVEHLITATAPSSALLGSANKVHLEVASTQLPALSISPPCASGDAVACAYWIYPDWVEVSYPALAHAVSDRLTVEAIVAPASAVAAAGFGSPAVWVVDVRDGSRPQVLSGFGVQATSGVHTVYWNEGVANPAYALSTEAGLRAPGAIERIDRAGRPGRWADSSLAYDYVAIIGGERSYAGTTALGGQLAAALQPLMAHRAAEGFRVAEVPVQDIYDEWSYGRIDPHAIRSFLSYAFFNWDVVPRYVLLVGDGHYDYNQVTSQTLPQVLPPYLADVDPWIGEAPTDNLYVSADGLSDYLPDMAVGRLPVNSGGDVTAMVEKILAYEGAASNPAGPWQQRVEYVAGDCGDSAGNFHVLSNDGRMQWLPTAYADGRVYYDLPSLPVCPDGTHSNETDVRQAVRRAYNEGMFYMQWFGHGSAVSWGGGSSVGLKIRDFRDQSLPEPLSAPNTQLPFTTAYACWTGYFVWEALPAYLAAGYKQSLAEEMVLAPQRGSIVDLSPSGLHVGSVLLTLQKGMHKKLFEERIARAGDVVDAAKHYFVQNSLSYHDVIDTMIFFGDPALKLRYPEGTLSVELEYFTGTAAYPNHILLEWQSVSEMETAGYRLFRGVTPNPDEASLLVPFIQSPNPGTLPGAYFSYEDSFNLTPGVVYYYWIEDMDMGGVWHQHRNDPSLIPVVPWGCSIYDVVCDFVIDTQDIAAIASLWNCALDMACYDDHFDVNDDDVIDVLDAMLTASRWGCLRTDACYN